MLKRLRRSWVPVAGVALLAGACGGIHPERAAPNPPPAAVTDLRVERSQDGFWLLWTAPGADGNTGTATSYDIRWSDRPITDASWAGDVQILDEPRPRQAGAPENYLARTVTAGDTCWFALRTRDEQPGNWSALSNVVSSGPVPFPDRSRAR